MESGTSKNAQKRKLDRNRHSSNSYNSFKHNLMPPKMQLKTTANVRTCVKDHRISLTQLYKRKIERITKLQEDGQNENDPVVIVIDSDDEAETEENHAVSLLSSATKLKPFGQDTNTLKEQMIVAVDNELPTLPIIAEPAESLVSDLSSIIDPRFSPIQDLIREPEDAYNAANRSDIYKREDEIVENDPVAIVIESDDAAETVENHAVSLLSSATKLTPLGQDTNTLKEQMIVAVDNELPTLPIIAEPAEPLVSDLSSIQDPRFSSIQDLIREPEDAYNAAIRSDIYKREDEIVENDPVAIVIDSDDAAETEENHAVSLLSSATKLTPLGQDINTLKEQMIVAVDNELPTLPIIAEPAEPLVSDLSSITEPQFSPIQDLIREPEDAYNAANRSDIYKREDEIIENDPVVIVINSDDAAETKENHAVSLLSSATKLKPLGQDTNTLKEQNFVAVDNELPTLPIIAEPAEQMVPDLSSV